MRSARIIGMRFAAAGLAAAGLMALALAGLPVSTPIASAATAPAALYFTVPASPVPSGGTFSVAVMVDASQPLNAYAVLVGYAGSGRVTFLGANNAHSIISVWQNLPAAAPAAGAAAGVISFGGGSLTPFEGKGGELMTLNFAADTTGTVTFSFGLSYVYLANGKGTKVVPQTAQAAVIISAPLEGGVTGIVGAPPTAAGLGNASDTTPPEIAYLAIVADPSVAGQKLLAFRVTDAGSGVRETDMRTRTWGSWSAWQPVQNPAPLAAGVWEVDFRVVDNAGNVSERALYDRAALAWSLAFPAAALVAVIMIAWWFARRRRYARRRGSGNMIE